MTFSTKRRPLQLASVIQKTLVEILYQAGIKNVTISEVRLSPDVKHATVFFCCLQPDCITEGDFKDISPFIKERLSKSLRLRFIPEIKFKLDTTFDTFSKIDSLLNQGK